MSIINLQKLDTEKKAYIYGFMCADGSITLPSRVRIGLAQSDAEYLEMFASLVSDPPMTVKRITRKRGTLEATWDLFNKTLAQQFISHGCVPNKTFVIKGPRSVESTQIRHFIRGYLDGDGSVGVTRKGDFFLSFSGNHYMLEWIAGQFRSIYYSETKPHRDRNVAGLNYDKKPAQEFAKWIYTNAKYYMKRKYEIAQKYMWKELPTVNFWSTYEQEILVKNSGQKQIAELRLLLPNRVEREIRRKAKELGCEIRRTYSCAKER